MNKKHISPGNTENTEGSAFPDGAGRLSPGDAHQFNNMIAVIKLYAQLGLRNPTANEELKESFHIIHDQASKAILLIDKVMEGGQQTSSET
jgi:hypothetical protein